MRTKPGLAKKLLVALGLGAALVAMPLSRATVSDQDARTVTSLGNGVTTNYTIGFTFQDNDDVHVYLQDEGASPYTRTEVDQGPAADEFQISGGDPGTTVVMGTAPAADQRLVIVREMDFTQSVDYVETDAFPAESHERAMDKQILLLQEINDGVNRCLKFPVGSTFSGIDLPDPEAGKVLRWNSAEDAIENADQTGLTVSDTATVDLDLTDSELQAGIVAGSIANSHVSASAAIAKSKLALTDSIVNADINSSAAIAYSKLADMAAGSLLLGNASNVPTVTAITGDIFISDAGVSGIQGGVVSNVMHANMAPHTFKGNNTGLNDAPRDLTATQLTAELNAVVGDSGSGGTKGLVPAPAAGDAAAAKFLKADGNWAVPAGAGTVTSVAASVPTGFSVSGSPVTTSGTLAIASAGAPDQIFNLGLAVSASAGTMTVALKQADGSSNPGSGSGAVIFAFRDPTATNGDYTLVSVTGSLSLSLAGATTLGGASGSAVTVYVYAVNNGGTVILAASLNKYDEGTLQSTSTSASSNQVLYASSAVSNKAVRLIGRFVATNTTSSWASPAEVSIVPFNGGTVAARYFASSTSMSGTAAVVSWTTKDYDTHNMMSAGTATIPLPGKYQINSGLLMSGTFALNNSTSFQLQKNGTTITEGGNYAAGAVLGMRVNISDTINCAAGDTIRVRAASDSTSPSIASSNTQNYFSIIRVGD